MSCRGILCNAGFETPSEAIFMGKKLCVIPMKNQFEQACNASFLVSMKIQVIEELTKSATQLNEWIHTEKSLQISYPDQTREILEKIITENSAL